MTRNPSLYGTPNTRNSNIATGFPKEYTRSGASQIYGEPRNSPSETYSASQRSFNIPESTRLPVQKYGLPRFGNQSPGSHGYQSPMVTLRSSFPQTYRSLSTEYGAPGTAARDSYSQDLSRSVSNVYGTPSARTPAGEYGIPEARNIEKTKAIASSYAR